MTREEFEKLKVGDKVRPRIRRYRHSNYEGRYDLYGKG